MGCVEMAVWHSAFVLHETHLPLATIQIEAVAKVHSALVIQAVQAPVPRQIGFVENAVWHSAFEIQAVQAPDVSQMGLVVKADWHSEFEEHATHSPLALQIGSVEYPV